DLHIVRAITERLSPGLRGLGLVEPRELPAWAPWPATTRPGEPRRAPGVSAGTRQGPRGAPEPSRGRLAAVAAVVLAGDLVTYGEARGGDPGGKLPGRLGRVVGPSYQLR